VASDIVEDADVRIRQRGDSLGFALEAPPAIEIRSLV
jgi:hypothetical protein